MQWSAWLAEYLGAVTELYDHLDHNPDRAVPCFANVLDRHEGLAETGPLSPIEEELVERVKESMEWVAAALLVTDDEAFSLNELSRFVYDPFPTRLTIAVEAEVVDAAGFNDRGSFFERPAVDVWNALRSLEGRWISPDLVTAAAAPVSDEQQPNPDVLLLASLPRYFSSPPTPAEVEAAISEGAPGDVFLLENVRFHREETTNESSFARALSRLGDLYVDDAFATVHRAHASTVGIADHLPAYAGFLMEREIAALSRLESPERPYVAIVGGKKARSKLGALRDLAPRVDEILIGGGVALTFLGAYGADVGDSLVDEGLFDEIREIGDAAEREGTTIHLPEDVAIGVDLSPEGEVRTSDARAIPAGWQGLDIGPKTIEGFTDRIVTAKTVVWTGPLGAFEVEPFSTGTRRIGEAIAASDAYSVIGGGETAEAMVRFGLVDRISYVSTGGGACLALLRGKQLPALEALRS